MTIPLRDELRQKVANGQAILVVGAGVSVAATLNAPVASWVGLIRDGARHVTELNPRLAGAWLAGVESDINLGVDGMSDLLISAAQKVTSALGGTNSANFRDWLRGSVGRLSIIKPDILDAIRSLPCGLLTTNYDHLLEKVTGYKSLTWRNATQHEDPLKPAGRAVVHLHGSFDDPESVIFGHGTYSNILADEPAQLLQRAASSLQTLVFVGCGDGLADPNFTALRGWLKAFQPLSAHRHFVLCRSSDLDRLHERFEGERLTPLSFGDEHDELPAFLQSLVPEQSTSHSGDLFPHLGAPEKVITEPRSFNLPMIGTNSLIGRQSLVAEFAEQLTIQDVRSPAHPWVISGMSGVGKTALAAAISASALGLGRNVAWCRGSSHAEIVADLRMIATLATHATGFERDHRFEQDAHTPSVGAPETLSSLIEGLDRESWLLVLDAVPDWGTVEDLGHHRVQVLITSTSTDWPASFHNHTLRSLSQDHGLELLRGLVQTTAISSADSQAAAAKLVDNLGGLPFALLQAGAFIRTTGISVESYVRLLAETGTSLIDDGERSTPQKSLSHSLDVNIDQLTQTSPQAARLLTILSFGSPSFLPLDHLLTVASSMRSAPLNALELARSVASLARLSLVEATSGLIKVHNLVGLRVRERLNDQQRVEACTEALYFFSRSLPSRIEQRDDWVFATSIIPHVLAAIRTAEMLPLSNLSALSFAQASVIDFYSEKQPRDGLHIAQSALPAAPRYYDHSHAIVLRSRARIYRILRKYREAVADARESLRLATAFHGAESSHVRVALMDLSQLLPHVDRKDEALKYARRALRLAKTQLPQDSEAFGEVIHFVGAALERAGRLPEAKDYLRRALDLSRANGARSSEVAHHLNHLSVVLEASDELDEALDLRHDSLSIYLDLYGLGNLQTYGCLRSLADMERKRGNLEVALGHHLRSLESYELVFGTSGAGYTRQLAITLTFDPPNPERIYLDVKNLAQKIDFQDGDRRLGNIPKLLTDHGDSDVALGLLDRVKEASRDSLPDMAGAHCTEASVLESIGRRVDAIGSSEQSLRLWRSAGEIYAKEARNERKHLDRLKGRK